MFLSACARGVGQGQCDLALQRCPGKWFHDEACCAPLDGQNNVGPAGLRAHHQHRDMPELLGHLHPVEQAKGIQVGHGDVADDKVKLLALQFLPGLLGAVRFLGPGVADLDEQVAQDAPHGRALVDQQKTQRPACHGLAGPALPLLGGSAAPFSLASASRDITKMLILRLIAPNGASSSSRLLEASPITRPRRLGQAMLLQQGLLAQIDAKLAGARDIWLAARARLAALQQVLKNKQADLRTAQGRLEQKQMDELAATRFRQNAQTNLFEPG